MKRRLALLLAAAVVMSAFTACGGSGNTTKAAETVEKEESNAQEAPADLSEDSDSSEAAKESGAGIGEEAPAADTQKNTAAGNEVDGKTEEMRSTVIGGLEYFYADTAGDDDVSAYLAEVKTDQDTNVYRFAKEDLTQLGDTDIYYTVMDGVTPLSGTLYGYMGGEELDYNYVYGELGVEQNEDYDVVSSATAFTGSHFKDIPSVVQFGMDEDANKMIVGIMTDREPTTVDADIYVAASILNLEGKPLSQDQMEALMVTLKADPMNAPSESVITPRVKDARYVCDENTLKYGLGEFDIIPDDTVEGYVWNEYLDSIYAATISDGTTVAGAVHWIDLYGEAESNPEGDHYNKIQIALNNGKSPAENGEVVDRYAAFFNDDNTIKPGTYTIRIYADGYDTLEATVEVP